MAIIRSAGPDKRFETEDDSINLIGIDFESAIGVAASSLGNVGPALGEFGPANNFFNLPSIGKWWASFLMLIGRLELFTVLILFTPFFWRNR